MTTTEGNRLIAEFMGGIRGHSLNPTHVNIYQYRFLPSGDQYFETDLKYHTSWDWLMPVVEKINKWHIETMCKKRYFYLLQQSICSSKEMVWEGCIEFISWYNNQDKQP